MGRYRKEENITNFRRYAISETETINRLRLKGKRVNAIEKSEDGLIRIWTTDENYVEVEE